MDSVILESVNLNDLAYEEIKKRIISREFAPGQRLVDSQLATIFQISRTPIRDAMRRLTKEGLLTNTSSRGFYVFAPTLKDIDEIFSISGMIETEDVSGISGKCSFSEIFSSRYVFKMFTFCSILSRQSA